MKKVIVTMPEPLDRRFKHWAKILTGVDKNNSTGYCFQGDFVPLSDRKRDVKREFNEGDLILFYSETGSRSRYTPRVILYIVEQSELREIYNHKCSSLNGWALEVRDEIAQIVENIRKEKKSLNERLEELRAERDQLLARVAEIDAEISKLETETNVEV